MKLAFVSTYDPEDVLSWSGVPYYMLNGFRAAGIECEWVKPERDRRVRWVENFFRAQDRVVKGLGARGGIDFAREPAIQKAYCANVAAQLKAVRPDLVFSSSSLPIAYLDCPFPTCFWTDATFGGMVDFYPEFSNLSPRVIRRGWSVENASLRHCAFSIYACEWAAQTAIKLHRANPATTHVIPLGANIDTPSKDEVLRAIRGRRADRCQLLFLGTSWKRKGGDIACEVGKELNARGLPTDLVLVGCEPAMDRPLPSWIRSHGFVSKQTGEGRQLIQSLLEQSHFLIVPSRAECVGIASSEASAHGLPSLVTRVGGMQSTVHDGVNGMTFDVEGAAGRIADYVCETFVDRARYEALAESSYDEFVKRLNWRVNIEQAIALFKKYL